MTDRRRSSVRRLAWAPWIVSLAWLTACSSSPAAPASPSSTTTTATPATTPPVVTGEACTYTLSTTSQSIIGEGGSFSFNLTRTTGTCGWTAIADSWITVSPSSGNGSTQVTATVGRNGSPDRTGAITISWTSAADGPKSARLTVSQNDLVPLLVAGSLAIEPQGTGVAAATAFEFSFATKPSGGIPPYRYSWNFADGTTTSGNETITHVFPQQGNFQAVATVTDNRGVTATTQIAVPVLSVTGTWRAVATGGGFPRGTEPVVLSQTGSAVAGSINDVFNGEPRSFSGSGSVSHPRQLTVTLRQDGLFSPIVYTGTLDVTATTWTGTATGWLGCPCTFVAGKLPN